jgi:hypothetical protein
MPSPRKALLLAGLAAVLATQAAAQDLVTTARLNLRSRPSLRAPVRVVLANGEALLQLGDSLARGFVHVRAGEREGWVWAGFLAEAPSLVPAGMVLFGAPPPPSAGAVSRTVLPYWPTPTPLVNPITNSLGACPAEGRGRHGVPEDPFTDSLKNRTDAPGEVHEVTFQGMLMLAYPRNRKKSFGDFTAEDQAQVRRFSGRAVSVQGYLLEDPVPSGEEAANCMAHTPGDVDWHMYLGARPGDPKSASVIAETTPRVRPLHRWDIQELRRIHDTRERVRMTGWLMLDPEHYSNVTGYVTLAGRPGRNIWRGTIWEIHPVTRIEVCRGGQWVDLDGGAPGGACTP